MWLVVLYSVGQSQENTFPFNADDISDRRAGKDLDWISIVP